MQSILGSNQMAASQPRSSVRKSELVTTSWGARLPILVLVRKGPDLDNANCQQYGFLLAQVRLNSKFSVVLNALLYFWLGIVCLYILILKVRHMLGFPGPGENRRKRTVSRRHLNTHIELLHNLEAWVKLIVVILVTVATELTIDWNNIEGVNSLSGAGQTIPFFIGLGDVLRILCHI